MPDMGGRGAGLLMVLLIVAGVGWLSGGSPYSPILPVIAADQGSMGEAEIQGAGSQTLNPHSDLIFRATGAKSCGDCHRTGRNGGLSPQAMNNELVRGLIAKAKGVHGPGRFADCLRCHAGGRKGVERYQE